VEKSKSLTGGYLDAAGTPSPSLMSEIQYVDSSIGRMMSALEAQGIADSTLIIVSAKHGQSPIDPNRVLRIPADDSTKMAPSNILGGLGTGLVGGGLVGQADEDDVSMLWLTDPTMIASAVATLQKNENVYGGGEIFVGPALSQLFNSPSIDSRTPDIIIAPNVGVTFTGGKAKISVHGGFSNDDRNVMLLVSNSRISPSIYTSQVETRQIAPTILMALGINPNLLQAVLQEKTQVLPGLDY
jgi:arylsulfatase A-like enzyme